MATILIVSTGSELPSAIAAALAPGDEYRIVHRASLAEAAMVSASVCILEIDLRNGQSGLVIEQFRGKSGIPLIACTAATTPELEEEAYLKGAAYVLVKPVRARLLIALLKRLCTGPTPEAVAHVITTRVRVEAGNYLVPLDSFHRMFVERRLNRRLDEEFMSALEATLGTAMWQATRFLREMWLLGASYDIKPERLQVRSVLEQSCEAARRDWSGNLPQVTLEVEEHLTARASRDYMEYVLAELILNGWHASPGEPKVRVSARAAPADPAGPRLRIQIEDNGPGFSPEALRLAKQDWLTIEALAAGGGLVTSRKILQHQQGTLEIPPPKVGGHGVVVVTLPMDQPQPAGLKESRAGSRPER